MKERIASLGMCMILILLTIITRGQNLVTTEIKSKVVPLDLYISKDKTVNLIFNYAIKSVDRGSSEVLAQKAKGVENILQVKAATDTFKQTNLTVVTAEGTLYSFMLFYKDNPQNLNYKLGQVNEIPPVLFRNNGNNEGKIYDLAEKLRSRTPLLKKIKSSKYEVTFRCSGIYIKEDTFYWQLNIENNSNLDYLIDRLSFTIIDQKRIKRTASQQLPLDPTFITGNPVYVGANSSGNLIIAIPLFTIPDRKELLIQLFEKNGGRNLDITIKNKDLIMASPL